LILQRWKRLSRSSQKLDLRSIGPVSVVMESEFSILLCYRTAQARREETRLTNKSFSMHKAKMGLKSWWVLGSLRRDRNGNFGIEEDMYDYYSDGARGIS
jgi:hypothetical protein